LTLTLWHNPSLAENSSPCSALISSTQTRTCFFLFSSLLFSSAGEFSLGEFTSKSMAARKRLKASLKDALWQSFINGALTESQVKRAENLENQPVLWWC